MCFSNHPEKGQICIQFPIWLDCKMFLNLCSLACIQELEPSILYWCHPQDIQCFGSTGIAVVWGYKLVWFWVHMTVPRYRKLIYFSTNNSFTAMRQVVPWVQTQDPVSITINKPGICFSSALGNRFTLVLSIKRLQPCLGMQNWLV